MSPRNATEIGQRREYNWRNRQIPSVTTRLKGWPMEWGIAYGAKHAAERAVFQHSELVARLNSDDPVDWTLKWLKAAPHQRRDAAAQEGTNLHEYLEGRWNGTISPDDADEDGLSPAEVAIEQFLAVYQPDPLFVEAQVFNLSDNWAGSADAFVTIYGKRYVLDLKTAPYARTDHKARLQLAAYAHGEFIGADDEVISAVPQVDGGLILSVPRDNPSQWMLIETPAGPREYATFLACAKLWDFYDTTKGTDIGEMLLPQTREAA